MKKSSKYNFSGDYLWEFYITQKLSIDKISELLEIPRPSVYMLLKRFNIPRRTSSEAHLGQLGWCKGTKGIMKPNSGSFKRGHNTWNKGKQTNYGWKISLKKKGNVVAWNKGKKMSESMKEKMRQIMLGHIPWNKGKKTGQLVWNKGLRGERSHSWRGGLSFGEYTPNFNESLKEMIRQRDSHKCQLCSCPQMELLRNRRLDIHHIDYNKKNNDPKNLITLCNPCNGKVNWNRERWKEVFNAKISLIYNILTIK